ncbi:hypothetical protein IFM89_039238 [Coptis chinensis]|uniref:Uncharacterized protein n=1 Tax=Coptis chinensis TaxID=261450 RepID=A0A835IFD2_9MAGN|nr:hypothetical protein IFM89_039238 [Coptis chinensis]
MGRAPCCDKANVKRGPWSPEEDFALKNYVERHGTGGNWISLPQKAGEFSKFLRQWSVIASQLQGRTDNDVKNYWNTKLKKKILAGKITLNGEKMLTSNNHLQPSSSSSLAMHNASQNDNKCFSSYLIQNSTTVPMSMNVNVGSSRLLPNSVKLTFPGLVDSPEFSVASANNPNVSSSSSSDVPSLPIPLAVPLDNNYSSWWSGNGSDEDDRFFMEFGFGSSYDLFNGFCFQERTSGAAAPSLANYPIFENFLANSSDTKPQGLYQSITN